MSFLYYPFGIFFYKRFSHNKKNFCRRIYNTKSYSKNCYPVKIGTILYPAQIHQASSIFQKAGCLLGLYEIGSTKHKKPLADIYTSQIHVIWDKNRLVSIMLKFYRTAIIAKSFLGDGTYIQIKEIPEHSWQENIEGNFI